MNEPPKFSPSEFIAAINQTLDYTYHGVLLEGEVASFKVNQGKWVFFDLKDEESSVACFMPVWELRMPIEDGMKVLIKGTPKVTQWGKFSFTVQAVQPVGEGNLKKAYELLKRKLTKEGLFDPAKKRSLPEDLVKIGIISSTGAAGYKDFVKIINARWGGMRVQVAHTQVQGLDAPDQMIRALKYFNEHGEVQLIAMIRGGGSADDLACFNDEALVRAVAASKIPVATGIGHEVDESLTDLAADIRASTPSNLAEMITPDKQEIRFGVKNNLKRVGAIMFKKLDEKKVEINEKLTNAKAEINLAIEKVAEKIRAKRKILEVLNPEKVLQQGYAILNGKISPGNVVKITTMKQKIEAEVKKVQERSQNERKT